MKMDDVVLTSEQKQAARIIRGSRISILTGAPGVGKTFLSKYIIDEHEKMHMKILLCAPSGKAARRLSQSTGRIATTIHSMLKARMIGNKFVFRHNESERLDADLIVVDESSMIDSPLMADLLRAVRKDTKLIFIGDDSQLPPVGMGCPFRDFIASGVIPVAELTEIQRNSGQIVHACHQIKDGQFYIPSKTIDLEDGRNLIHVECGSPNRIRDLVTRIVTERMPVRGYNPIWDVQVLSPTNKRTTMSCQSINGVLQAKLNQNHIDEKSGYGVGDKVINTRNFVAENETYVANGDLGEVTEMRGSKMVVKFFDPERHIELSTISNDLLHAYCCTTHRYQGSEVPVVVIPVHSSFNFFVTRPWIYTAISRARDICITVGEFSAVKSAIKHQASDFRVTRLKKRLAV